LINNLNIFVSFNLVTDKLTSLHVAHNKRFKNAEEIEHQKKFDPYLPVMHPWACCVLPIEAEPTALLLDGRHHCLWKFNPLTGTMGIRTSSNTHPSINFCLLLHDVSLIFK
jgi:hypothetical protein